MRKLTAVKVTATIYRKCIYEFKHRRNLGRGPNATPLFFLFKNSCFVYCVEEEGRDNTVGIATPYGLDGPEIESRWGARFSAPVQAGPGVHPASYTMGIGSFSGVKRPVCGVDPSAPSSAEVKERVELYPGANLGLGRLGSCLGR